MNEIKIFENNEFGKVRTVVKNGEPWFVGKDIAEALGYRREADAIAQHVEPEDKGYGEIPTPGGNQAMIIINESGLYSLIMGSKLPNAKRFKRWVTSDVLPSIRKTGHYGKPPKAQSLREVVQLIQETRSIMQQQGNTPAEIAEAIKSLGDQYGIRFPSFFVKPEDTRLNDVFDMIDYIYSQPRGRGKPVPTYEGYVLFKLNEQKKLEGVSE